MLLHSAQEEWAKVWGEDGEELRGPSWRELVTACEPIPPLAPHQFGAAALSFDVGTASTADGFHPRQLGHLSEGALQGVCDILAAVEATACSLRSLPG